MSDEQIAANQLQVDSSLEAIDRIAQTTSFQGRRLLDGSLDFLTTNPGNALLRASGTVGTQVDVSSIGSFTGAADANARLLLSGQPGATGVVTFSAISAGTGLNGISIQYVLDTRFDGGRVICEQHTDDFAISGSHGRRRSGGGERTRRDHTDFCRCNDGRPDLHRGHRAGYNAQWNNRGRQLRPSNSSVVGHRRRSIQQYERAGECLRQRNAAPRIPPAITR